MGVKEETFINVTGCLWLFLMGACIVVGLLYETPLSPLWIAGGGLLLSLVGLLFAVLRWRQMDREERQRDQEEARRDAYVAGLEIRDHLGLPPQTRIVLGNEEPFS